MICNSIWCVLLSQCCAYECCIYSDNCNKSGIIIFSENRKKASIKIRRCTTCLVYVVFKQMYWKLGMELLNKPEEGRNDHYLTGEDDTILIIPTVLE